VAGTTKAAATQPAAEDAAQPTEAATTAAATLPRGSGVATTSPNASSRRPPRLGKVPRGHRVGSVHWAPAPWRSPTPHRSATAARSATPQRQDPPQLFDINVPRQRGEQAKERVKGAPKDRADARDTAVVVAADAHMGAAATAASRIT